jgi:hypothetical protein
MNQFGTGHQVWFEVQSPPNDPARLKDFLIPTQSFTIYSPFSVRAEHYRRLRTDAFTEWNSAVA